MRKIAIALSKGGVGKTTTAVSLAAGLARSGKKVLLMDTDTQNQAATSLGVSPAAGLADVLEEDLLPSEAIHQVDEQLHLLAAGDGLAGAKRMIARKDFGAEHTLSQKLSPLDGEYDYIILDTAPGWDALSVASLFFVDEVLSPVSLEALTLSGLADFVNRLKDIQGFHEDIRLSYLLPTFLDGRVRKSEEILGQLKEYFGEVLCDPIRYNVSLSEAAGRGQHIFSYAPKSPGAIDYQTLTEKVISDG